MTEHSPDRPFENVLHQARRAAFWSPIWSACAALLVSLPIFVMDTYYDARDATFLFTPTWGIWLILLAIHLRILFLVKRLDKTQDTRTLSHLKRAARLVILLPWGSCFVLLVTGIGVQIYEVGGDTSRLFADIGAWIFLMVLFWITVPHIIMLVVVYATCYPTLRLYSLLEKEHCGTPSGCFDAIALGLIVLGIGILFALCFHYVPAFFIYIFASF